MGFSLRPATRLLERIYKRRLDEDSSKVRTINRHAPTRLLVIANALIPTVQLSLLQPLRSLVENGEMSIEFLTESELKHKFGSKMRAPDAGGTWFARRLTDSAATHIFICRYSGPFAREVIDYAQERGIPSIYCIDDDLLNVPIEIGIEKHKFHNHPLRLDAVRFLLEKSSLVYCSNQRLARRLLEIGVQCNPVVGQIFCAGTIISAPLQRTAVTMGYMGFDHAHDFEIALPAVVNAMHRHPQLHFELFGRITRSPQLEVFGSRVVQLPVVADYTQFLQTLSKRKWDIGICPLAKTSFNEVKNINKWIEYTSVGTAVIATRGMIYDECCADGCGWLTDDNGWDEAFEKLLVDTEYRVLQVTNAQRKLAQEFTLDKLCKQVLDVFRTAESLTTQNCASPLTNGMSPGDSP